MKHETATVGDVPFFKIGTFGRDPDAFIPLELFNGYKGKYSFPKKGDVLISAAGTIGRTVIYDGEPAYFQDSNIVWLDNDETQVLNRYLYYVYSTTPWKASNGGTISRLYNDDIRKTKIPLPSREVQDEIVCILDKFSELTTDIIKGLPAEIAARKKQYEYYRDRLLRFEEVK
jgi:type I restriction enzyme S subunit